ncbi:unnamed protein product [Cuscuta epithymum]|uniref:Bifunctional inhibitor/plant lipid transfer protein/seed storage helical domain-containing protein n=1 Tax=Cuscuta epithymum TaxID=186058 RepID=A0AAV0DS53_9ASTE|nr:unnamed protein product [Cuscuta epithymum]
MKAAALIFSVVFLLLLHSLVAITESHWSRKPVSAVCASQITLVNHACSFLIINPSPPPGSAGGQHRHHRRPHHGHHHHSPEEEICCRWLKEVDDQCVCDMLVSLPPFLARPLHQFTVQVGDSCFQTYRCGTPMIRMD